MDDERRDHVPDHWHRLGARRSPITRTGTRRATNPLNAVLNYLYALAEIECHTACLTLGLDPGLGYFHDDIPYRDSLALDLLEAIRPDVDAYTLDLIEDHVFAIRDFTEHEDGHCRILSPLTHHLAATMLDWQIAIAPHAEHIAELIAVASPYRIHSSKSLTRPLIRLARQPTGHQRIRRQLGTRCRDCGTHLAATATQYCPDCLPARRATQRRKAITVSAATLATDEARRQRGRQVSEGRAEARRQAITDLGFTDDDWTAIAPAIRALSLQQIMDATGLAITQASRIKTGKHIPQPKHWGSLGHAAYVFAPP